MRSILIVDDDAFVRAVYEARFRAEGWTVTTAPTGERALEVMEALLPDLVLLDLQMPGLDGAEVLKRIRTNAVTREVPVVVFSNNFRADLVDAASEAGATRILSKTSATPNEVVDAIRSILTTRPAVPRTRAVEPAPEIPPEESARQRGLIDLRRQFTASMPPLLARLQSELQSFVTLPAGPEGQQRIEALIRTTHGIVGGSTVIGYQRTAQLASALQVLFEELRDRPGSINLSTLRTILHAARALAELYARGDVSTTRTGGAPLVLAVDDDPVARRAVSLALEKAALRAVAVDSPALALQLLALNRFDLAFLDVDLPGMSGFSLCAQMRALPTNEKTPAVFVTALKHLKEIAGSNQIEKNEVIGKPFAPIELAVKALTYLL